MLSDHRDIPKAKRIVVKVGSSSITGEKSANLAKLVEAIANSQKAGQEIVLVTSGAIATALPLMNFATKPEDLTTSQALAAIGQSRLMLRYQTELENFDLLAGQVLLSASDLDNEESSNNAKAALDRLLDMGVIPIVNENDTVATQEIRFGDNDRLAALVAILVAADALVLLSDVDALYDRPPTEEGAQKIEWVEPLDDLTGIKIGASSSQVGTGGAVTKLQAARTATDAGITVLLTSIDNVSRVLSGERVGTWFRAKED
ncbi:MAG: glutamate 5-kinase [Microbacteriaceae bacterium]|nr:glutamate 5-kinase [Microbacteriaceae bacterium]